ncbi:aspartic peptidase domain-containing protein [Lasiosphaeris hirsuta]|uniref:Aspartic peptidase domain-containing protein n=1 Tax=Lasiosphaeris hirsuta TaxID=260670 RepID=A0AA40A953_9PEZI|nr:aspartic peptidase domain-containing protein [Lasiosphaeris hirsuta]
MLKPTTTTTTLPLPHRPRPRPAPLSIARTHHRHGLTPPPTLLQAAPSFLTTGSVAASPLDHDEAYIVTVRIGTPPQLVPPDFDSNSADLWVAGPAVGAASEQRFYDPAKTASAVATEERWNITYAGRSEAGGRVWRDVVDVGGVRATQAVEVADREAAWFETQDEYSRFVGLGLGGVVCGRRRRLGTYDFGYVDAAKYVGDITYTAANNSRGWWDIVATSYAVGEASGFVSRPLFGVVNTGSSLLYLPRDIVNTYYAGVASAVYNETIGRVWLFGCNETLPISTLGIEDTHVTIPSEYLNYWPNGDGTCWGRIQAEPGLGYSIYGNVLLKAAFVVFDTVGPRMGGGGGERISRW